MIHFILPQIAQSTLRKNVSRKDAKAQRRKDIFPQKRGVRREYKDLTGLELADHKTELNSSTTDQQIATQR